MVRFICAAMGLAALLVASPGYADTEPYQLRTGESVATVVARHYGSKSYLPVLKLHTRIRPRARTVQLPSLRQILFEQKVQSLEPNAFEKILQAQEEFLQASRANAPSCDLKRRWQPKDRQQFEQAAKEVNDAAALLTETEGVPRGLTAHLTRAGASLQELGDKSGRPGCKSIGFIHKQFAAALATSIVWARRQHRNQVRG
jgi:hypothetical protein